MRKWVLFAMTVLLTLPLAISCGPGEEPTATPAPTWTPIPRTLPGLPTIEAPATPTVAAVVATPTGVPTPTVVAVVATPTGVPTPTVVAVVATPTPVRTPTATPVPKERYGGILIRRARADPRTLDLNQETSVEPLGYATDIFSTLVRIDSERLPDARVIIRDLAESWTVENNATVFTFRLRPDVKFHDGSPLISADVKATMDRLMAPPTGVTSPLRTNFQVIKSVDTPDASTVVIRTSTPTGYLLPLLALPTASIVPSHIVTSNQKALEKNPVGSGPFKFEVWNKGVDIKLARNEKYYVEGLPYLDGHRAVIMPERAQQIAALRTGQLHTSGWGSGGLDADEVALIEKTNPELRAIPDNTTTLSPVQLNVARPPLDDVNIRRALQMVWDQTKLIRLEGGGEIGDFTGTVGFSWALDRDYLMRFPMYRGVTDADIRAARNLVTKAGYTTPLELLYLVADRYEPAEVKKMGVLSEGNVFKFTAKIVEYPAVYLEARREGNFNVTGGAIIKPLYDPVSQLSTYTTGDPESGMGLSDAQLDSLYQQLLVETDFVKKKQLSDQFQKRLFEDVVAAFPPARTGMNHFVLRPEVRGYTHVGILRDNFHFERVWLAK